MNPAAVTPMRRRRDQTPTEVVARELEHAVARPAGREAIPADPVSHDAIAQRAYAIFESRGRADGNDIEDWLEAERELQALAITNES